MPDGQVLEFTRVTKRFNDVTAVSDFSARVEPGVVTAFLGPNGAGKTTSLRILLGQVRPTSGTATIGGVAFADLRTPLRTIGSVLEETVYRPRRTANRQLTMAAKANGIPLSRVDEVLALVGLEREGEGRIGSFSLGMRQRLSVAHALLGDAGTLVFDEPANGLDPEGIRWMRLLMRRLADEGRTVLVSSHVLSEVEQIADNVVVLSKGRLVLSSGIEKLADPSAGSVVVDAADRAGLTAALASAGFEVEVLRSGLTVRGAEAGTVGAVAAAAGVALSTLVQRGPTLEDVFIELVRGGTLAPHAEAAASDLVLPAPVPASDVALPASDQDAAAEPVAAAEESTDTVDATDAADEDAAPVLPLDAEAVPSDPIAAAALTAGAGAALAVDDVASDDAPETEETAQAPGIADAAAGPSFDDILFGTANPEQSAASDAPAVEQVSDGDGHSGVEVFADLGAEEIAGDGSETDPAAADHEDQGERSEADAAEDEDPRSAAVSSMLAAAARAYYDDEPKDYPLGATSPADEQAGDGDEQRATEQDATEQDATEQDADATAPPTDASDSADAEGSSDEHVGDDTVVIDAVPLSTPDVEQADLEQTDLEQIDVEQTEATDSEQAAHHDEAAEHRNPEHDGDHSDHQHDDHDHGDHHGDHHDHGDHHHG
ncbi:ATP-binding cassette domain-containing protein [Streptomyces sp. AC495_CC817]|uniref:ATP-binding cassette domain-containing protein n=1 Tax=Streptomyces sp. AC495_CC817 TaxID=2823900 RepID=UPI001C2528FF|nr:ATP-binding cassette domain-containing protein [Streptomyces sp. AC495_CC817]